MTILVFGKSGQVASELARLEPGAVFLGRSQAELSDPASCAACIRRYAPEVVINAAAYTAVDKAEDEEDLATVVNGDAPGAMAATCAELGIPFVHISTDYVFAGDGNTPWQPDDPTGPLGAYGRSKLAGEKAVQSAGGAYAVLRTSWVFSEHGSNFLKTMLRLSESRDALNVVDDQIGGPTPASAIAAACLTIAQRLREAPETSGVYHFSGDPDASWADFAREIFTQAGRSVTVTGIPSSQYPTPAARPLNSRMSCETLTETFGIQRPDWREAVSSIVERLT